MSSLYEKECDRCGAKAKIASTNEIPEGWLTLSVRGMRKTGKVYFPYIADANYKDLCAACFEADPRLKKIIADAQAEAEEKKKTPTVSAWDLVGEAIVEALNEEGFETQ